MSTSKRKADSAGATYSQSTKSTSSLPARPHKRQKSSDVDAKSARVAASDTKPKSKKASSVVQKEEKSFPRGGASVLTPLEHKQIQNEATRDVLFEQTNGKRKGGDASDNDESIASDEEIAKAVKSKTPKKKKRKREDNNTADGESKLKIEGLSYNRLNTGALVLGQIVEITSRDLAIALPNNLTGFVRLTEISEQLNRRVEALLAENRDDGASDSEDDFEDISLKKLFQIGQYVRAYVLSSGKESSAAGKKRIELSLNPKLTNTGISQSEILPNVMLQASVSSVEDHGLIMDFGIPDLPAKGFLSSKQLAGLSLGDIEEGAVFLCLVVSVSANGRTATLSLDTEQLKNTKRNFLSTTSTIRAYTPGTAVDILVSDVSGIGLHGKIAGSLDATIDLLHLGLDTKRDVEKRFALGTKLKARIIFQHAESQSTTLGASILPNILALEPTALPYTTSSGSHDISSIIDAAKVVKVLPKSGLYLDIGAAASGFAHISRLSEKKIEKLSSDSGTYKEGSKHKARIIGFNAIDNIYLLSLESKIISQPFLRVQDVKVGSVVQGTVERVIVNDRGVGGVLINLAEGISGLAGPLHLADVQLQHPERKFKEGLKVKARVLAVNRDRRRISLTLKKSLVNSDVQPWSSYENIQIGSQSPGTIVNLLPTGAVVQFYGSLRGFLPRDEMSEAFIKTPADHFKLGQVVNVRVSDLDVQERKLKVSCKEPSSLGPEQLQSFDNLAAGDLTKGTITEIGSSDIMLDLDHALKGILSIQHLADGSETKAKSLAKRLHVGQVIGDLVVLRKNEKRHLVVVSHKPDIIKAARGKSLITKFEQLARGAKVFGFVRNITDKLIFVEFAGSTIAIIPASKLDEERKELKDFGYEIGQTISAFVATIDNDKRRVVLTSDPSQVQDVSKASKKSSKPDEELAEPVSNLSLGQTTEARIMAVKPLQLNVELMDKVPGRVDTTEIFNEWSDIKDWKHPLVSFKVNQIITVRVVGLHDAKSRTYLPFSHRKTNTVFELSMKQASSSADSSQILHTEKLIVGEKHIGIVTKHAEGFLLVKLSPSSTGRLLHVNLCDDVSKLKDVVNNFPIGSALHVTILRVDVEANKVELTAKSAISDGVGLADLALGDKHTGRVAKVSDHGILVQLSRSVAGFVPLVEIADDYSSVNMTSYTKNDVIEVKVISIDQPNKKVTLSARPSVVLDKTDRIIDKRITSIHDLKVNDIVRGFIKNVADKGLFLHVGPAVTAFVKISDLSDAFHKDWKPLFKVGQLVKGKVLRVEEDKNNVIVSLKPSMLDKDYKPQITFADLEVGQVHTAKVRKVESFGVFIVIVDSNNVSGLCHRSEIADNKVTDVAKLYDVGDMVKAIVIKIDKTKGRVNFGLKKSYFTNDEGAEQDGSEVGTPDNSDDSDNEMADVKTSAVFDEAAEQSDEEEIEDVEPNPSTTLSLGGFDWNGGIEEDAGLNTLDMNDDLDMPEKKRKKKKPTITVDKTGELDKYGPQSVADFERLLLGKPSSSSLWIQYMAFQLGLGEVDKARTIAERALKTINIREEDEKLNMWIALLNLENTYGSEESMDDAFKRACSLNDKQEIHERLVSIFIESGKHEKAEELFQQMTKMKELTAQTQFWVNYATFLLTTRDNADGARSLLMRAMQSVPEAEHRNLTAKFGALEFTSPKGDTERGRTVFEGLLSTWPKRTELWDMYIDLERSHGKDENVRALYERMTRTKLKKRRAKFVFKKWLEFEERAGDKAKVDHVTALATAYVKKLQSAGMDEEDEE